MFSRPPGFNLGARRFRGEVAVCLTIEPLARGKHSSRRPGDGGKRNMAGIVLIFPLGVFSISAPRNSLAKVEHMIEIRFGF